MATQTNTAFNGEMLRTFAAAVSDLSSTGTPCQVLAIAYDGNGNAIIQTTAGAAIVGAALNSGRQGEPSAGQAGGPMARKTRDRAGFVRRAVVCALARSRRVKRSGERLPAAT